MWTCPGGLEEDTIGCLPQGHLEGRNVDHATAQRTSLCFVEPPHSIPLALRLVYVMCNTAVTLLVNIKEHIVGVIKLGRGTQVLELSLECCWVCQKPHRKLLIMSHDPW
jgi:hypothetical protein